MSAVLGGAPTVPVIATPTESRRNSSSGGVVPSVWTMFAQGPMLTL